MDTLGEVLQGVSVERIRNHIKSLEGVRHPVTAPVALEQAADYLRETLAALGYSMSEHCFDDHGHQFANVIATKPGSRYPDRRVVVLAHFDTVSASPGADDNASGVAVLLELATVLNSLSFERSIQFIGVNLEESSNDDDTGSAIRGSAALARFARERITRLFGTTAIKRSW